MRFTAQEELGLRCMVQMAAAAAADPPSGLTIAEIAGREGLTPHYVAKLMRLLRLAGLVASVRGQHGGYRLARPAVEISLSAVMAALGERFHTVEQCRRARRRSACVHLEACPIRPLWAGIDRIAQRMLERCSLVDLLAGEREVERRVARAFADQEPMELR
jgi:Rrf2 family iron-sulfur cluster assembly transcriptional regulator